MHEKNGEEGFKPSWENSVIDLTNESNEEEDSEVSIIQKVCDSLRIVEKRMLNHQGKSQ